MATAMLLYRPPMGYSSRRQYAWCMRMYRIYRLCHCYSPPAYINVLQKAIGQQASTAQTPTPGSTFGSGLIAASQLEALREQLDAQDLSASMSTARRYLRLGNDPRALFATIALVAAQGDAAADQGHTLQIVQAAGEEFMAWPAALADTNSDAFLNVALRAAAFAKRNDLLTNL